MEKVYIASALIFYNEKILLAWNEKKNLWMQPNTKIITDLETPEESLIRQIYNSIGYEIKIINVNQIRIDIDSNCKTISNPLLIQEHSIDNTDKFRLIDFFYLATLSNKTIANLNLLSIKNFYWFSKDEILKLLIKDDTKKIILKAFQVILNSKKDFSC